MSQFFSTYITIDAFLFNFSKRLCLRNQTVVTVIDNYLSPDVNTAIFQIVLQPESRKVYCKNSNYSKLGAISADFHRLASRHKETHQKQLKFWKNMHGEKAARASRIACNKPYARYAVRYRITSPQHAPMRDYSPQITAKPCLTINRRQLIAIVTSLLDCYSQGVQPTRFSVKNSIRTYSRYFCHNSIHCFFTCQGVLNLVSQQMHIKNFNVKHLKYKLFHQNVFWSRRICRSFGASITSGGFKEGPG